MIYALDTNIVVHYLREDENVRHNFKNAVMLENEIVLPRPVDYELRRGFRVYPAPKKQALYEVLTEQCVAASMGENSWKQAERIWEELYNKRLTVGELDILIAAVCLVHGYTLVTNNTKDFENIEGLRLEDWTKI